MQPPVEPRWQDTYHDNVGIAFTAGLVMTCVMLTLLVPIVEEWDFSPTLLIFLLILFGLVVFLLATIGLYKLLSFREPTVRRFFLVNLPDALQVVKQALVEANIPFRQEAYNLILDNGAVTIEIYSDRYGRRGPWGSVIRLRPCTSDQQLLINTLRAKIDEAFLPKGLTP